MTDIEHPSMANRAFGFTLIELLIAIAVFAIMGVLAYSGLNVITGTQMRIEEQSDNLKDIQLALRHLQNDISQLMDRPIRNLYGDQEPPFVSGEQPLFKLTRGGRFNPANLARSHLQRVAYDLNEGTLVRVNWPVLDGGDESKALTTPLVDDIEEVEFRFVDDAGEWHGNWPPTSTTGEQGSTLPAGIEITLNTKLWGKIRRFFALPN